MCMHTQNWSADLSAETKFERLFMYYALIFLVLYFKSCLNGLQEI